MKKFYPALASLTLLASTAIPAHAEMASPTVRPGDFYSFRGMPAEMINYLPAHSPKKILKGKKLGNSKYDNSDGHDLREVVAEGEIHIPVILVNFKDYKFTQGDGNPNALINDMLNGENFTYQNATGSAREYYRTVSSGQFSPVFDVYGPVTLEKEEIEYVTSNADDKYTDPETGKEVVKYPAGYMVAEAVKALDDEIDFSKYDMDKDGFVDFVYFFFAGHGATLGGSKDRNIWPHAFTLTSALGETVTLDDVQVNRYCCSAELGGDNRKLSGVGTFVHEFSHVLGFPDLYDTAHNGQPALAAYSPGPYSNMDSGNYNNDEHTPPFFSGYEQYAMEWMKPTELTGSGNITLLPLEAYPFAYKVPSNKNVQEYFILENRAKSHQDQYLPSPGLLVWHIDFDLSIWNANTVNTIDAHQRIDLIEADNHKNSSTTDGDPFPGASGVCEFSPNITPSFKDWSGKGVGFSLSDICHNFDGTTTFTATCTKTNAVDMQQLPAPAPRVCAASTSGISIKWPAVKDAEKYFISVFEASKLNGDVLSFSDFETDYYFRSIEVKPDTQGLCSYEISGLRPNVHYAVMLYAAGSNNASRMETPVFASTIDGADFANARTNLYIENAADTAVASWDAVEGADDYTLSIVTRTPGATTNQLAADFTGNRLPEDWTAKGKFESNARHCGEATPSYCLSSNFAFLASPVYEEQMKSLSFWAKTRYDDPKARLEIYTADKNGNYSFFKALTTELDNKGKRFDLELPANSYGVRLSYTFKSTGLEFFIDDIKAEFCANAVETPVNAAIEKTGDTEACVRGLEKGVDYIAYVTPVKSGADGAHSNEFAFRLENLPVSGVEDIMAEDAASLFRIQGMNVIPADGVDLNIYTIDGLRVAAASNGVITIPARGIYIISAGSTNAKVRF